MKTAPKDVDSYIAGMPVEVRKTLAELRRAIKKAVPEASERISYGMPFYEYGGSGYKGRFIYFAAFKKHISVFIPPSLAGECPRGLEKYHAAKASFHFPLNKPFPYALISKTVKALKKKRDMVGNVSRSRHKS
jgi:uncharacterized protein YdhG (YjbR/CyaY superfamily)